MKIATFHGPLEIGADYWRETPSSRFDQAAPRFFDPAFPHNVGDWYLSKIVDRVLDFDELVVAVPDSPPSVWDEINDSCAAFVLRGGNYISPDFLSRIIGIDTIRRVKIPIILFGAGIQDVPVGGVQFTDEEAAILRYIHDSCAASAVRGNVTAATLASIGIENTIVTGCPTFYWSRRPQLEIRKPQRDKAAFTLRQGLYSTDPNAYRSMFSGLEIVREQFADVVVVLQGEEVVLQRLHQVRTWGVETAGKVTHGPGRVMRLHRERIDEQALVDEANALYASWASPEVVEWMLSNTFFSWDISDYLDLFREQDVVIGCRLHSNLLSLANGTPALFLTYDERTREIVDFMGVPSCPLQEFSGTVDVAGQDWSLVEDRYRIGYARFVDFLESNGLAHRLPVDVSMHDGSVPSANG